MIDYTTAFPNSRKVYDERAVPVVADGAPVTIRVPMREVSLSGGEPPVRLYDTSGPQGHDVRAGLPKLRAQWVEARRQSGGVRTQLAYARREKSPRRWSSSRCGKAFRLSSSAPR